MGPQGLREDIDISTPIDLELALKGLGGDTSLFWRVLSNFESNTLDSTLRNIVPFFEEKDHHQFQKEISILLHASGSIGASRVHCICFLITEHHFNN